MSLLKKFATVGGATLVSRVFGFTREMMMASALGIGPVADAFNLAFRFPNLFRRLFAEGAFNAAFIPLFARSLEEEGEAGARRFASEIFATLFVVLTGLTIVAMIFMPFLVKTIIAPGLAACIDDPETLGQQLSCEDRFGITVAFSRIMFPYLACMSLMAMVSGILNAFRRFFAAAAAPTLLNFILIGVLAYAWWTRADQATIGFLMSWGVLVAGVGQLLMVTLAMRLAGFSVSLGRPRWTPGLKRLLILAGPAALIGGITQINLFVGQAIASYQPGAVSILTYADRPYQLPLGMVGVAIGVVLLPELARALKAGRLEEAQHTQNRSLEFALFLTVPAAVALFVMPEPIIRLIYERGAFGPDTTEKVAAVLGLYALGLPAFVLIKVFSPGYFARENTRTPMIVTAFRRSPTPSCPSSCSGSTPSAGSRSRRRWPLDQRRASLRGVASTGAVARRRQAPAPRRAGVPVGCLMGGALLVMLEALERWMGADPNVIHQSLAVLALAGVAMLIYFALAFLTGAADRAMVLKLVRRKRAAG